MCNASPFHFVSLLVLFRLSDYESLTFWFLNEKKHLTEKGYFKKWIFFNDRLSFLLMSVNGTSFVPLIYNAGVLLKWFFRFNCGFSFKIYLQLK